MPHTADIGTNRFAHRTWSYIMAAFVVMLFVVRLSGLVALPWWLIIAPAWLPALCWACVYAFWWLAAFLHGVHWP